jgi:hypothetical protein
LISGRSLKGGFVMKYTVVEVSDRGYVATVPVLARCASQRELVRKHLRISKKLIARSKESDSW